VDGQVLVYHDILKYGVDRLPKFVEAYADVNEVATTAIRHYVESTKDGSFPLERHTFTMDESLLDTLYGGKA